VTADQLLTALFNAGIAISVGATVLSLGMTFTVGQLVAPLHRVVLVIGLVVLNAVVIPAAAWGIAEIMPMNSKYVPGLVLATLGAGSAAEIGQREPALNVLVNNAGATWGAPIEDFPATAWDKVVDLNLKAPFFLTRAFLPLLEASGTQDDPARVINIGSIDGLRVPPFPTYAYSASKAGLHHLTRVLARELGPRRITVNAVAPGPFESKMMAATLKTFGDAIADAAPLKRIGRPDDMAGVAIYLASRAGADVTGAVIPVDGGIATTV
jgi:NAD(P)-dependent dehydrogenase (short-subunit alcohol dehydrogenase family)